MWNWNNNKMRTLCCCGYMIWSMNNFPVSAMYVISAS